MNFGEVLIGKCQQGRSLLLALSGALAFVLDAFDVCFYGNDLGVGFGFGVDVFFIAFLYFAAEVDQAGDILLVGVVCLAVGRWFGLELIQGGDEVIGNEMQGVFYVQGEDVSLLTPAVIVDIFSFAVPVEAGFADGAFENTGEGIGFAARAFGVAAFHFCEDGVIGFFAPKRDVFAFAAYPLRGRLRDSLLADLFIFSINDNACIVWIGDDAPNGGALPLVCTSARFDR